MSEQLPQLPLAAEQDEPPRCSIITVTFQALAHLPGAVASVAALGRSDIEHVIIDGASQDGTAAWLQAQTGLRWISEPDAGIYDAMRKGLELARGRSVLFLGADDRLLPGAHALIDAPDPEGLIAYGDVELSSSGQRYRGRFRTGTLCLCNICHQALRYPRAVLLREGFDPRYRWLADHELNLRLWGQGHPFHYVDTVVTHFNDQGGSAAGEEAFLKDLPHLIARHLGRHWAWWYRYRMLRNRCKRWLLRQGR